MSTKVNLRSPFYIKYTDTNLTTVSLSLYIYSGTVEADKGQPIYTLKNDVIAGTDFVVFELSEFARDYFTHTFDGTYPSNTLWVTVEATLYNDQTAIRSENANYLAFDGYTNFKEGLNSEGSRAELMTTRTLRVPEGETVQIPIFSEEVISITSTSNYDTGAPDNTFWNAQTLEWQINSNYWDSIPEDDSVVITDVSSLSGAKIQYFTVDSEMDLLNIATTNNSYTIIVDTEECYKYGKRKITFINKHGAFEDLWFTGVFKETTDLSSEDYTSSAIDFNAMSFDTNKAQNQRFHINSKRSFTINSGFVHENMTSSFEELLMSEYVWLTDKDGIIYPITPSTNSLDYKTHLVDKLINHELSFSYAFNNNNTVI